MSEDATAIVITDQEPGPAVAAVARDTGHASWLLQPVRLSAIATAPRIEHAGSAEVACPSPTSSAALFAAVSKGEPLLFAGKWAEARDALAVGETALACLGDAVEASTAARLFLLLGVARFELGDLPGAERAYLQARALQPSLVWDKDLPGAAQDAYDRAASAAIAHVTLEAPDPSAVFVDGRPAGAAAVDLTVGPHVVQVIGPLLATRVVEIAPADAAPLRVIAPLGDDAVHRTSEPEVREGILAAAAHAYPGKDVYVWDGEAAIDATHGWTTAKPAVAPRKYGQSVLLGGTIITAVGATAATYGFLTFQNKIEPTGEETPQQTAQRFIRGGRAGGVTSIGMAVLVEGIVVMGVGVPWALYDGRVRGSVGPTGATVTVGGK